MAVRQIMVAANWKMNGLTADAEYLGAGVRDAGLDPSGVEVVICPPFTVLRDVAAILKGSSIRWGGQNLFWERSGAYTGEISGEMLRDLGCRYVIVGHSERRQIFGETDAMVQKKIRAAFASGLAPIVCIGETERERRAGETQAVVARQLDAVLETLEGEARQGLVVAYEPVWAIGTGLTATPDQAQEVHAFLRGRMAERDGHLAQNTRILYGGSVKGNNARELFLMPDIDGGLVGGASLVAKEFLQICEAALQG